LPQAVGGYFNAKIQHQTLKNQQAQGTMIQAQTDLARASTAEKLFETGYKTDTKHIRRQYDADRANQQHYSYSNEMKKYELAEALQEIQIARAKEDLANLGSGTSLRQQELKLKELQYKQEKEAYDYSKGGMRLNDWLKLGLGAASTFMPRR